MAPTKSPMTLVSILLKINVNGWTFFQTQVKPSLGLKRHLNVDYPLKEILHFSHLADTHTGVKVYLNSSWYGTFCVCTLVHPKHLWVALYILPPWNCRSAVNKAEFISAYASLQSLDFLALTETWITTDNTATPTALSSSAHVFSHTPRASGQPGGGTGILISPKWSFSLSPLTHLSIASF
jgi:hypothetical protein